MPHIADFLTHDHRACDVHLAAAETAAQSADWDGALRAWNEFEASMRCHFAREEELLFPAFEAATGHTMGPTRVMRMEHDQMRGLFVSAAEALAAHDARRFLGVSESLMVLVQQHNMKEEQILYPMCDEVLPDAAALTDELRARTPEV